VAWEDILQEFEVVVVHPVSHASDSYTSDFHPKDPPSWNYWIPLTVEDLLLTPRNLVNFLVALETVGKPHEEVVEDLAAKSHPAVHCHKVDTSDVQVVVDNSTHSPHSDCTLQHALQVQAVPVELGHDYIDLLLVHMVGNFQVVLLDNLDASDVVAAVEWKIVVQAVVVTGLEDHHQGMMIVAVTVAVGLLKSAVQE